MNPHDPQHPPQHTQSSLASALGCEMPLVIRPDFEPLRKKDGTLSKIRSHRGNIPVLPQTKLCPHCPAKFTRTTHLNRHLRNRMDYSLVKLHNNTHGPSAQIQTKDFIAATYAALF
ncbi:hypothetical protein D9756_007477 [Leucocoprinus leucothites]|uniref:C2H2-type domain-containing protein n=1 Tax=Leucocoprinus leucothites TaxID=201217 RepID=A0A8H5D1E4_9AGAR|nr:hypothetical protein D9756_007477 [Leucoagaricus leucothites]